MRNISTYTTHRIEAYDDESGDIHPVSMLVDCDKTVGVKIESVHTGTEPIERYLDREQMLSLRAMCNRALRLL